MVFPVFSFLFPALSLAVMRRATSDLLRKLGPFHISLNDIQSLGGADGNRTHVLKVTELLPLRKELCGSGIFIPCVKKNHAVVLVLRHQELWVCELLTNRHHRSCLCVLPQQLAHNILTSESLKGKLN